MSFSTPAWLSLLLGHEAEISIIGVITNIFHIFILTRSEMRTSSTNVIMTGIAISDWYYATYPVGQFAKTKLDELDGCFIPPSYIAQVLLSISGALRDNARRSTVFLGLSMAIIRVLVIKKPLVFENMTSSKFGLKTALSSVALSSLISFCYFLRTSVVADEEIWSPDDQYSGCDPSNFPVNYTRVRYGIVNSDLGNWNHALFSFAQVLVDGVFGQIIPAILFPILTVILIQELHKITASHNKLFSDKKSDKSNLTTRIVTYMTISFLVSTVPSGVLFIWYSYFCDTDICRFKMFNWVLACSLLFDINTNTHFLINLFVSSQYRSTVKRVLRIRTEQETTNENTVSVTRNPQN